MTNNFNLLDLFQQTWGYRPLSIPISDPDGGLNVNPSSQGDIKFQSSDLVNRKSVSGNYGSYYKPDGNGRMVFMPTTFSWTDATSGNAMSLTLPYSWISIKGSKRLVETAMTERRGTVTEQIAMEDYRISLKGFLIGQNGIFPEADMESLRQVFEVQGSIDIDCILADIFLNTSEQGGQTSVIIMSLDINDNPGVETVRSFEMELKTDQIFNLTLT